MELTASIIICCRVADPDPACILVPQSVIGFCVVCGHPIRIAPSSVELLATERYSAWCVQCVHAQQTVFIIVGHPS